MTKLLVAHTMKVGTAQSSLSHENKTVLHHLLTTLIAQTRSRLWKQMDQFEAQNGWFKQRREKHERTAQSIFHFAVFDHKIEDLASLYFQFLRGLEC